jgi:hypothetical protein
MVGQLVLFSALLQNVEALNVATMALLVFFMARPFSHWIRCEQCNVAPPLPLCVSMHQPSLCYFSFGVPCVCNVAAPSPSLSFCW